MQSENPALSPVAINYHLTRACDAKCLFCFARFANVKDHLPLEQGLELLRRLRAAGGQKLNFAGGEPTLHPHLGELLRFAKELGFVTGIVTNGRRLEPLLESHGESLDWVGLSVDSSNERIQHELGRGAGDHVERCVRLAALVRARGIRLKLNTVVTALTWHEDMSRLVLALQPERWKVFQVLRVEGQNDGRVEPLLVTPEQFEAFVQRHTPLVSATTRLVAEDHEAMTDSYVMIDPMGRFFGDTGGRHRESRSILEVGVHAALSEVGYDPRKFEARGGRYDY